MERNRIWWVVFHYQHPNLTKTGELRYPEYLEPVRREGKECQWMGM